MLSRRKRAQRHLDDYYGRTDTLPRRVTAYVILIVFVFLSVCVGVLTVSAIAFYLKGGTTLLYQVWTGTEEAGSTYYLGIFSIVVGMSLGWPLGLLLGQGLIRRMHVISEQAIFHLLNNIWN
jgi:hypothetical protein